MTRTPPPVFGDERATLVGYLDFQRATLLVKCAGLTPAQLATRSVPTSTLTLLGLVRHLADVEQRWFQYRLAGLDVSGYYVTDADIDGDFNLPDPVTAAVVEDAFSSWQVEVDRSNEIVAGVASLDQRFVHEQVGELSVRWLLLHMVEEYARHNGHADLLREAIDGLTGE